jgi:hypothetical protein
VRSLTALVVGGLRVPGKAKVKKCRDDQTQRNCKFIHAESMRDFQTVENGTKGVSANSYSCDEMMSVRQSLESLPSGSNRLPLVNAEMDLPFGFSRRILRVYPKNADDPYRP